MATFSGSPFPTIAIGRESTVAVKPDGSIQTWGSGTMVPAPALTDVVTVTNSSDWGLAVHGDGSVTFLGTDPGGTGVDTLPAGLANVVQADSSNYHAAVTHSDGTVTCWGYNANGQCDVPVGLTGVFMVVAGDGFTIALKTDGAIVEWGSLPGTAPAISAGAFISCFDNTPNVLLDDGTVVAWGSNSLGQADVPAGLTDVVSLASGGSVTLVTKSDGTLDVWPDAYYSVPAGLGAKAFALAGQSALGALSSDGTLDMWDGSSESTVPSGFEAMVPGDPPPATSGTIDATVPFTVEISATTGPIASFDVVIPFSGEFRAYQDWTKTLDPIQLQEVYRLIITGSADGLSDLEVGKISSWQATNQAGNRSSFLQAVAPVTSELLAAIESRSSGELVIEKGFKFSDGSERYEEILRSNFDDFRYDRGARSFSATVSGYLRGQTPKNATRTLSGIRTVSLSSGKYRVRCNVDLFLQPGMTVNAGDVSFKADYINYYVSDVDKFCEVSER